VATFFTGRHHAKTGVVLSIDVKAVHAAVRSVHSRAGLNCQRVARALAKSSGREKRNQAEDEEAHLENVWLEVQDTAYVVEYLLFILVQAPEEGAAS